MAALVLGDHSTSAARHSEPCLRISRSERTGKSQKDDLALGGTRGTGNN